LKFTSSLADSKDLQVLLVSGAFHYWEKGVGEFLRQFADRPEHILINRSPLHETLGPFVTVQRTQACAFPCIVHNARELIAAFATEGYVLVDRWQTLELSLKLPLFPDETVPFYSGLYLKYETR
jgi:putative methyltransferase (TIGR04325 family)